MSRDILVRGNTLLFWDTSEGDVTALPKDSSLISVADWRLLVGEPAEGETFEQREAAYIKQMGWKKADEIH